jgi:hypothetical protein
MAYTLGGVKNQQPAKAREAAPKTGGIFSRILGSAEEKTEVGVE